MFYRLHINWENSQCIYWYRNYLVAVVKDTLESIAKPTLQKGKKNKKVVIARLHPPLQLRHTVGVVRSLQITLLILTCLTMWADLLSGQGCRQDSGWTAGQVVSCSAGLECWACWCPDLGPCQSVCSCPCCLSLSGLHSSGWKEVLGREMMRLTLS